MSVRGVFGVNLRHPMYEVDEILLDEDPCQVTINHPGFLLREQLAAFVPSSSVISTPGLQQNPSQQLGRTPAEQLVIQQQQARDLEERAVIQVPLWVARAALVPRLHAKMNSPAAFSARSLLDFKSDPFAPLVAETKGARFFDYGVAVSAFLPQNEAKRVREAALDLYRKRYDRVVLEGIRKGTQGTQESAMRSKLTGREMALYLNVAEDVQARNTWRRWLLNP
jgi:hypothetical protein